MLYNIIHRKRENKYFMKTQSDDATGMSITEYYDSVIKSSDNMQEFLAVSTDEDKVRLYQYVLNKATELSKEDQQKNLETIQFCWLASMELEHTEAIQNHLHREDKDNTDAYDANKEQEIQEIVNLIEAKRKAKNPLNKIVGIFRR